MPDLLYHDWLRKDEDLDDGNFFGWRKVPAKITDMRRFAVHAHDELMIRPSHWLPASEVVLMRQPAFEALTGINVRTEFHRLAETWRNEVLFSSSTTEIVLNQSYQRIIGLGPDVLPFILGELARSLDHWFWALAAITGHEPTGVEEGDSEGLRQAWLAWGREHGLI
jgi:hypothetical protein